MNTFAVALSIALPLLSGCIFEPGLGSSPTSCPRSVPVEQGFLVVIEPVDAFVGYCLEVSRDGSTIDDVTLARKVPEDGRVHLPIETAGRYYLRVSVEDADDRYCADRVGEFAEHPGTGLVQIEAEPHGVCA